MKNTKLFQSLSKLTIAVLAGLSVAALPGSVLADHHEDDSKESEEGADKDCSDEKGCGSEGGKSDKGKGEEGEHDCDH